jgi:hypothetical protein
MQVLEVPRLYSGTTSRVLGKHAMDGDAKFWPTHAGVLPTANGVFPCNFQKRTL